MVNTEADVVAPDFHMGPVQGAVQGAAGEAVATKAEDFLLPANALVSQMPSLP